MKYRSRIDIISQVLETANGGNATRKNIMYKGLLSYNQMKENLMLLTEYELLRYDKDTQMFRTTEKGLRFLQIYNQIDEMINEDEDEEEQKLQQHSQPQQKIWIYR